MRKRPTSATPPAPTGTEERRPGFVDALAKGLRILAAFEHDAALGNSELAESLGLPKATVSRLTGTLVTLGYLQVDDQSRKYMLGSRLLGLGANLQRHIRLQRAARPMLQELADTLNLNVVIGTLDGVHVLMLEGSRAPRGRLTVNYVMGSHMPLGTTAIGMGCIIAAPMRERARLLEELRRAHPDDWTQVRERVEQAHADCKRQRFIVSVKSDGEMIAAAAVPFIGENGRAFCFAAIGPAAELPRTRLLQHVGPALADRVDDLARQLGGSPATAAAPARTSRRTVR